jgi:hypothetical protein
MYFISLCYDFVLQAGNIVNENLVFKLSDLVMAAYNSWAGMSTVRAVRLFPSGTVTISGLLFLLVWVAVVHHGHITASQVIIK